VPCDALPPLLRTARSARAEQGRAAGGLRPPRHWILRGHSDRATEGLLGPSPVAR